MGRRRRLALEYGGQKPSGIHIPGKNFSMLEAPLAQRMNVFFSGLEATKMGIAIRVQGS